LQAVQRVIEEDRSIAEVARELGISPNALQRWKQEYLLQEHPGPLPKETAEQELRRLRRDNERLRQERDFLKEAVGFFAHDPE
jgi:transposase